MLKELYNYAVESKLVLPAGFVLKPVKAYIRLLEDGSFLDIQLTDGESVRCPDIGSLANGTDKCNALAEKRSVVLPEEPTVKSKYFRQLLAEGGEQEPMLKSCLAALEDPEIVEQIEAKLNQLKIKSADRISFCVDGNSILESSLVQTWWIQFRKQFQPKGVQSLCLITGRPTVPMATVPPISGLGVVGGHARGDALICFDKSAFCSYGLKQAANAPVSEEAYAGVKAALDKLLTDAPVLAGMKFVHWYDRPIPQKEDVIDGFLSEGMLEDEDEEENEDGKEAEQTEEAVKVDRYQAQRQATDLVTSLENGTRAAELANEYFIVLLSGVNGRVMIRHYERGSYQMLQKALSAWNEDLRLENDSGTGTIRPVRFKARLVRLLSWQKSDRNVFKRMDKELSGLTPAVIQAILLNAELPDEVASRALAYVRSRMMGNDGEEKKLSSPDRLACQWLKVWLLRRERKRKQEETLTMGYHETHPNPAYHCGGLVAVYGAIQRTAMPDVNASVIDRYYASASQTPALILGQLQRLSTYHLGKITFYSLRELYEGLLNEVSDAIGDTIPSTLSLEDQAYFALGYRQMSSKIAKKLAAWKAEREEQKKKKQAEQEKKGGNEDGNPEQV